MNKIKLKVLSMARACGYHHMSEIDIATVIFDAKMLNWDIALFDIMEKEFKIRKDVGIQFFKKYIPNLKNPPAASFEHEG